MLVLRDFTFIEHHFLDKIAILTKLSAEISLKLLQSSYTCVITSYRGSPSFRKIVGTETAGQFQPQDSNPTWNSSFCPLQGFPRLTLKHETPDKVSSVYQYGWFQTAFS